MRINKNIVAKSKLLLNPLFPTLKKGIIQLFIVSLPKVPEFWCSFFLKHKITNFRELLFYYKKKFKQLHTFITKIYEELRKTLTPHETKSQLMLITGHTTMLALQKYLRDIDVELPEDYSDLIDKVNKNN